MLTALRSRCSSWKLGFPAPNRIFASSPSFSSAAGVSDSSEVLTLPEVEKILTAVKADDVTVIPNHNHGLWADFTVIATGRSDWHLKNIAQALVYRYKTFSDPSAAKAYIQEQGAPIVIKGDGLAAGKGVIVAVEPEEAFEAVDSMLVKGVFGSAGCQVVVEEFLEGEEASFFVLVDGKNAIPLESAQDHKAVWRWRYWS